MIYIILKILPFKITETSRELSRPFQELAKLLKSRGADGTRRVSKVFGIKK